MSPQDASRALITRLLCRLWHASHSWYVFPLTASCDFAYLCILQRGVFSEKANQGDKFWDQVDASLVLVAQKGKGDAERISRYDSLACLCEYASSCVPCSLFKYFLDKDRKAHGTGAQPPVDESDIDNLQENIDQAIEERNRRLAVRQGQAEDEEDEEERDSPDSSPTLQNDR